jgi:hypothetical protein
MNGLLGSLLAFGAFMAAHALAHQASDFYISGKYQPPLGVDWHFTEEVTGVNFRDRIRDGSEEWNALNSAMHFNKVAEIPNFPYDNCPTPVDENSAIHMGGIADPDAVAVVHLCFNNLGELDGFQMKFTNSANYYTGTGDPGANEVDTWSFGAHEFGHATGWRGHYDSDEETSPLCQVDSTRHTMCHSLGNGRKWWRTLEEHDKHTFNFAYP